MPGRVKSHDDRRPLRSLAAVFVTRPYIDTTFRGVRLGGCLRRFRGLPETTPCLEVGLVSRPPARRSGRNQITGWRFTPAAPAPSTASSKESNGPPLSPRLRRPPDPGLLCAGRPNRGLPPPSLFPEIRRAALRQTEGACGEGGRMLFGAPEVGLTAPLVAYDIHPFQNLQIEFQQIGEDCSI